MMEREGEGEERKRRMRKDVRGYSRHKGGAADQGVEEVSGPPLGDLFFDFFSEMGYFACLARFCDGCCSAI